MAAENVSDERIKQFKDSFKLDTLDSVKNHQHLLYPLVISNCNGTGPWTFSDATVDYKKHKATTLPFYFWYHEVFIGIAHELQGRKMFTGETKTAFKCLLNFVCNLGRHIRCLESLLTDRVSEAKVKTVLAIHYFQPLMYGVCCVIDRESVVICEFCKEKISYSDTSFGNRYVWHGLADIAIHKSVVKVSQTLKHVDDMEEDVGDTKEDADDLASGEPPTKQRKEDDVDCLTSFVQVEKHKNKKLKSQAVAQGIVNAFCEAKRDQSLYNKFIPSFLATDQIIRIIMYNCSSDVLLLSEAIPIWKKINGEITLNTRALVQVWICLNFEQFNLSIPESVLEKMPPSKFIEAVGNAYPIYMEELTRPLKPFDQITADGQVEGHLDIESFKKLLHADRDIYSEVAKL